MSGHSKWHRIKHKKAAADAKRGQQFTKLAGHIKAAAKNGSDPRKNSALADAIERAKAANMPQANIDRLLNANDDHLETVTYECFGPANTSLIILAQTNNTNRTVSELRAILKRHGGSLGQTGSIMWKFKPQALISIPLPPLKNIESIELALIDAGAEDFTSSDTELTIAAPANRHSSIEKAVANLNLTILSSRITYQAHNPKHLDAKTSQRLDHLTKELLNHPDINQIHTDTSP